MRTQDGVNDESVEEGGRFMPVVDLAFPLLGQDIPADHGYALYSAVSRALPFFHGEEAEGFGIGIHPVQGVLCGGRKLRIDEKSRLTMRLSAEYIPKVLPLAGKRLDLDGHRISLGIPSPFLLSHSECLFSRIVVIKGFLESVSFLGAARRQCEKLGVPGGKIFLVPHRTKRSFEGAVSDGEEAVFTKRTLRIRNKEVVGFAVKAGSLLPEESLVLQEMGLGGRRKMGCGLFVPRTMEYDI